MVAEGLELDQEDFMTWKKKDGFVPGGLCVELTLGEFVELIHPQLSAKIYYNKTDGGKRIALQIIAPKDVKINRSSYGGTRPNSPNKEDEEEPGQTHTEEHPT